ncbi:VWA domain-containing protein [Nocardioidaceae bacterium]|nr:VWA domain-containing protein [Nocardioidaceae bacterium]
MTSVPEPPERPAPFGPTVGGGGARTTEVLVGFTTALRHAGVAVTADRTRAYVEAVALLGLADPDRLRWAGHATLCAGPDDVLRHDQVFEAWFTAEEGLPRRRPRERTPLRSSRLPDLGGGPEETAQATQPDEDPAVITARASDVETLRHRDVASMDAAERALLHAMLAALRPRPPRRRSHRRTPAPRGGVDARRTVRAMLRRGGEPARLERRARRPRPRPVVMLVDVSGSMSLYADTLLRLCHRLHGAAYATGGHVEVFSVGTRVTRLTGPMGHRDPERALVEAGRTVPDWSGGTRLGESLQVFLDRWGRRGLVRGAVVVVMSDGWERGDASLLGEQVAALSRLAHRVVWMNPHRGRAGYAPVQNGVLAVLPHVDDFVAGHSLAAYAELLEVVADA